MTTNGLDDARPVDAAALLAALDRLAARRPIFASEADLQHAFAWQLALDLPDLRVRLERRPDPLVREAADLWLTDATGHVTAVEIKYLIRFTDVTVNNERFLLANQGAHAISRYDVVRDLTRVERWVRAELVDDGVVIVVSNDPGYWRRSDRATIDAAFRLHDGRQLHGQLAWAPHTGGTTRGREAPLTVEGTHQVAWRQYATLPNGQDVRVLLLHTAEALKTNTDADDLQWPDRAPTGGSDGGPDGG